MAPRATALQKTCSRSRLGRPEKPGIRHACRGARKRATRRSSWLTHRPAHGSRHRYGPARMPQWTTGSSRCSAASEDMCELTGLPTNAPGFRFLLIPRLCMMRRPMRSSSKILTSEAALAVLPGALLWCRHDEVNKLRRCPLVTLCPVSVRGYS